MRKNLKQGFSLIELLVVVAIIGVLAAVGTVGYQRYLAQTRQKTTEANLASVVSALETAAAQAAGGATAGVYADISDWAVQMNNDFTVAKNAYGMGTTQVFLWPATSVSAHTEHNDYRSVATDVNTPLAAGITGDSPTQCSETTAGTMYVYTQYRPMAVDTCIRKADNSYYTKRVVLSESGQCWKSNVGGGATCPALFASGGSATAATAYEGTNGREAP